MKTLNFQDPIYLKRFRVNIYDSAKSLSDYANKTQSTEYYHIAAFVELTKEGVVEINLRPYFSINTIVHECWHALEKALFVQSDVSIRLDGSNEHIAYYLGWLTEKVVKFHLKQYPNLEKLDKVK